MLFRKMCFRWARFHIEITKITRPNFTKLVSPNAGGTAVDKIKIRFWKPSSVSKIFAAELRSHPKSSQILHVFGPWNFFRVRAPKFWTSTRPYFIMPVHNFGGTPRKNFRGQKHAKFSLISDEFEVRRRISPKWTKIFKIRQIFYLRRFFPR